MKAFPDGGRQAGVVFIASEAVLAAWSAREVSSSDVIGVSDADLHAALAAIRQWQPRVVVLEQTFVCTQRGAALIHRLRTNPAFQPLEIRLLSPERATHLRHATAGVSLLAASGKLQIAD